MGGRTVGVGRAHGSEYDVVAHGGGVLCECLGAENEAARGPAAPESGRHAEGRHGGDEDERARARQQRASEKNGVLYWLH